MIRVVAGHVALTSPHEGEVQTAVVLVSNVGRNAATVTGCGVETRDGYQLDFMRTSESAGPDKVDVRLEPYSSVGYSLPAEKLEAFAQRYGVTGNGLRGWATSHAGKAKGRKWIGARMSPDERRGSTTASVTRDQFGQIVDQTWVSRLKRR